MMEKQTEDNVIERALGFCVSEAFEKHTDKLIQGLFSFLCIVGIPYVVYLLYTCISSL
jgi:hypothetical protein